MLAHNITQWIKIGFEILGVLWASWRLDFIQFSMTFRVAQLLKVDGKFHGDKIYNEMNCNKDVDTWYGKKW